MAGSLIGSLTGSLIGSWRLSGRLLKEEKARQLACRMLQTSLPAQTGARINNNNNNYMFYMLGQMQNAFQTLCKCKCWVSGTSLVSLGWLVLGVTVGMCDVQTFQTRHYSAYFCSQNCPSNVEAFPQAAIRAARTAATCDKTHRYLTARCYVHHKVAVCRIAEEDFQCPASRLGKPRRHGQALLPA